METAKARPWPVPREGAYVISFRASRFPGEMIQVESAAGLEAMVENIRHVGEADLRSAPTSYSKGSALDEGEAENDLMRT